MDGQLSKKRVFTLGADPEMFIFSGMQLLPAFSFLPAKDSGDMQYWDGFQAEWKYNYQGSYCLNNLVKYTRENLIRLQQRAKVHDPLARLTLKNVVRVPQATLDTASVPHVQLGCDPSYNAYDMRGRFIENPRKLPYRFAGGHMHFGTWTTARPQYVKIVKMLDAILGVWSVGVARNLDNPIRRHYYGLAGEYRKPRYAAKELEPGGFGVEYRVLSNWWLSSPKALQVTWDLGRMCVRLAVSRYANMWAGNEQETIETINNCDFQQAEKILKRNRPMLSWLFGQVYEQPSADKAINLAFNGLESEVPEPENLQENWRFDALWPANAGEPWARFEWL